MNAVETNSPKNNLQIDFAPMVDLGFLLITFFVFTTQLQQSKAFGLNMPADGNETAAKLSTTITLLLKENGNIDYTEGNHETILKSGTVAIHTKPGLRDHLMDKRKRIIQQHGTDKDYTVLIQPTEFTSYKDLIDVLDEMTINDIKKYVLLKDNPAKQ